jgi:hypothetical protein
MLSGKIKEGDSVTLDFDPKKEKTNEPPVKIKVTSGKKK